MCVCMCGGVGVCMCVYVFVFVFVFKPDSNHLPMDDIVIALQLTAVRRRRDYIRGFIVPAIGPNKSKKLTGLLSVATQYSRQSLNKEQYAWLTHNKCFSYKL